MTLVNPISVDAAEVCADEVLAAHFTLVALPGAIETITFDGAEGWTSPNPHPALSLMRWTTEDAELAGEALDAVLARFRESGRGFDWMTGPRCAAAGLPALLDARGFVPPPLRISAMVRDLAPGQEEPGAPPPGFHVFKVADRDDRRVWRVMGDGFDVPEDVGETFHRAYMTPSSLQRTDIYAAAPEGSDAPVSVGYLSYVADGSAALLRVSSTAEEFRGRGLYRALVLRRVAEAAREGCSRVFVHAYSSGSRTALRHLGFREVGHLQLHRWRP